LLNLTNIINAGEKLGCSGAGVLDFFYRVRLFVDFPCGDSINFWPQVNIVPSFVVKMNKESFHFIRGGGGDLIFRYFKGVQICGVGGGKLEVSPFIFHCKLNLPKMLYTSFVI
jgi:hypothetical protein